MKRITFKEYYESKERLRMAGDECARTENEYSLTKYCKIPVTESPDDDAKKIYIPLKPKDTIRILWEYRDLNYPTPKKFILVTENDEKRYYPIWHNKKISKWIEGSTKEL